MRRPVPPPQTPTERRYVDDAIAVRQARLHHPDRLTCALIAATLPGLGWLLGTLVQTLHHRRHSSVGV